MTYVKSVVGSLVMRGARAGFGAGHSLRDVAARLAEDIGELRDCGGFPAAVRTTITVLPYQRLLKIRVDGLSVEADPDRTMIREVMNTLFELASYHNIVDLDVTRPPLFTQHIVLHDADGEPFAAMVGAGVADVELVMRQ
ncbi:MAG: hypothetical protein ABW215_10100 [Kibdelosporangium sp.]